MIENFTDRNGHIIWIDILNPTVDELKKIAADNQVELSCITDSHKSRHLILQNEVLYLCLPNVVPMDRDEEPSDVKFIITPKVLITIHDVELISFTSAKKNIDKFADSYGIFIDIAEEILYAGSNKLEEINLKTTQLSKDTFHCRIKFSNIGRLNNHLRNILYDLGYCGDKVSQIRDIQLGLQRMVTFIIDKKIPEINEQNTKELHAFKKDIQSITHFEEHLTNRIQFLLDAVLGFINTEQNDIFKVLTIVTVVGIPPTFIASWYGMNFHYIPEYLWLHGYSYVIILTIISIVVPIVWFKVKGWW
jgi:magnesium transporter